MVFIQISGKIVGSDVVYVWIVQFISCSEDVANTLRGSTARSKKIIYLSVLPQGAQPSQTN